MAPRGCADRPRSATNTQDARVFFRNRVSVMGESLGMPNKEVSLVVHGRGDTSLRVGGTVPALGIKASPPLASTGD